MKKLIAILDAIAFIYLVPLFGIPVLILITVSSLCRSRRRAPDEVHMLSLAIFDLISNKYSSMFEDALLDGYISRHWYIYMDFNHRHDRFENIENKIFFHSIAVHPDIALYNAGFKKITAFLMEMKALALAFSITHKNKISFIKAHDPHILGLNGLLASRFFRIPRVLHMNSDFDMKYRGTGKISSPIFVSRSLERFFETLIIKSYDLIMADRESYKGSRNFPRSCLKRYTATGVRVDATHYADPDSRRDLKEELGLSGKNILLYVGRLHPVKYPEDAVRAFALVKKDMADAALIIVGTGILKDYLVKLAEDENVRGSVLFLGSKRYEGLIDIFYTADVLLAPHGGVTLVESALASTPIVAYDFDWHSEFLEDGKMGYLVAFMDVKALAEKAEALLKDDPLREKMGIFCREKAIREYSRDISMKNEKHVYEQLIDV